MIDIFALYYLMRRIRGIVEAKGHNATKWRVAVLLFWFGGLFFGIGVSMIFFHTTDFYVLALSGYLAAIGLSIAVQKRAEALPDINNGNSDWLDNLGNDSYNN